MQRNEQNDMLNRIATLMERGLSYEEAFRRYERVASQKQLAADRAHRQNMNHDPTHTPPQFDSDQNNKRKSSANN